MSQSVTIPNTHVHQLAASGSKYQYQLEVKLPIGYDRSQDHYPVIYVLDGN